MRITPEYRDSLNHYLRDQEDDYYNDPYYDDIFGYNRN